MRRAAFALLLLPLLIPVFAALACDDATSHIYGGSAYEPSRNCDDPYTAIDVIDGPSTGQNCALVCVVDPADGGPVYATTDCPPYPVGFDMTGTNPLCIPTLAAYTRGDFCFPDGGSSNPLVDAAGE